jgi:hypothetical protein
MEKFDVIPVAENAPDRGDYPKIGNSNYRFNLWYKFPKKIKKPEDKQRFDNYGGGHNFESDDLIDYMRESMSGIKLVEDFDAHDTHWLSDGMTYSYRVGAFIPERKCGIDGVYAQKDMKSFDEIDFEKSGEWIAKMLEKAGAVLDIKKCNEIIKKREEEAKELLASNEVLTAIVAEAKASINSDKRKRKSEK